MIEYILVCASLSKNPDELVNKVRHYISQGYEPHGSISTYAEYMSRANACQAMVKKDNKE